MFKSLLWSVQMGKKKKKTRKKAGYVYFEIFCHPKKHYVVSWDVFCHFTVGFLAEELKMAYLPVLICEKKNKANISAICSLIPFLMNFNCKTNKICRKI